jgi:tRNA(Ile)-lysidine synthase TilS/MesJ
MDIPAGILKEINFTVDRYSLLDAHEEVMVAFSGGKDSIGLSWCLTRLGYRVIPVAVDMGYEASWAERIQNLGRAIGLTVRVIDVRNDRFETAAREDYHKILLRLEVLDSLSESKAHNITPCTHCYNTKVVGLDNAARAMGVAKIAFAHHLTDACTSLIKESLLRIDRLDLHHQMYTRANYESLVSELTSEAKIYPAASSPLTERITGLAAQGQVDTDEPPRQPLRTDRDGVDIVRPLFGVWEEHLVQLSHDIGYKAEGSGCGHGITANTE